MQVALGNPTRLVAIVGVAAALGAGALVMRGLSSSATEPAATPVLARVQHTTPNAKPGRAGKPKVPPPVAANGLPRAVAAALARKPVVVVSVFAPGATLDELAVREARAGAAAAGAGFVLLNAYRNAEIAPFAEKVGLRRNPAVVVMRRPGDVAIQLNGFADRDSVAQAATDARS
ncbi:MAG: hypothetical protein M3229_04580 [Actinomycetota bacterium]|nr:hypothetical protein [Actinomycetota bacterium]